VSLNVALDLSMVRSASRRPRLPAAHGVAVLLKVYTHCIDDRLMPPTSASPTPSGPRDEGDADSEPVA
jgi:hypothetical protein